VQRRLLPDDGDIEREELAALPETCTLSCCSPERCPSCTYDDEDRITAQCETCSQSVDEIIAFLTGARSTPKRSTP